METVSVIGIPWGKSKDFDLSIFKNVLVEITASNQKGFLSEHYMRVFHYARTMSCQSVARRELSGRQAVCVLFPF